MTRHEATLSGFATQSASRSPVPPAPAQSPARRGAPFTVSFQYPHPSNRRSS